MFEKSVSVDTYRDDAGNEEYKTFGTYKLFGLTVWRTSPLWSDNKLDAMRDARWMASRMGGVLDSISSGSADV